MMFLALDSEKRVYGPLGFDELERAVRGRVLTPETLVSRYGGTWHLAFAVPELRELFLKYRALHEPAVTRLIEAEEAADGTGTDGAPGHHKSPLRKAA